MADQMDREHKTLTDTLADAYRTLECGDALSAEQRAAVLVILASTCMERRRHERYTQAGANWEAQHKKRWAAWVKIRNAIIAESKPARPEITP